MVTRRYHAGIGEIDLVALDGDALVFVEVKERRAPGFTPEEAVGNRKMDALWGAARAYLAETGEMARECRFDLIAIDASGIRHHKNVFREGM